MPESSGEILATRVAFLELKDERRLVREGYELLDEKRVLLATEILRQLRRHAALEAEATAAADGARRAAERAIALLGFDDYTVQPKPALEPALVRSHRQTFLGVTLVEAALDVPALPETTPTAATPEARASALAFRRLVTARVALAACEGNLRRLAGEYTRTERRARALENVVLPEIDDSLRFIEERLDAADQEEAVRVRSAAGHRSAAA